MKATLVGTVAAVLLAVTMGEAHAVCAWVLWYQVRVPPQLGPSDDWSPASSFTTRAECIAGTRRFVAGMGSAKYISERPEDGTVSITHVDERTGKLSSLTFGQCLPDTVDPRGPKGR